MGTEIGKAKSKGKGEEREEERGGAKEEEGREGVRREGGWRKFGLLRQSYASLREGGRGRAKVITTAPPLSLSLTPSSLLRKRQKMVQQLERQRAGEGGFNMVV